MANDSDVTCQWREIISYANDAFEKDQVFLALVQYRKAIALAVELVKTHPTERDVYAALLVSYHNIADLYLQGGAIELAAKAYAEAHLTVSNYSQSVSEKENSCEVMWALRTSHKAMMAFSKLHPKYSLIDKTLTPDWLTGRSLRVL